MFARLDARLNHEGPEPLALALSGGSDSRALLALAAAWARSRQRALVALTVDHRLNPQSEIWTQQAGQAAAAEGVPWQALSWDQARAGSGIQARARQARHGLLAEATRAVGGRVLLVGHTLDDAAENQWMQSQGSSLGHLREWSASPVWPQGRDIMLMRPLLSERRQGLRDMLAARSIDWIDDPANENLVFQRVRARQTLQGAVASALTDDLTPFSWVEGPLAAYGALEFSRAALAPAGRALATALLCTSGQSTPPRAERLQSLQDRLLSGEDFVASLAGARLMANGEAVVVLREAGEMVRSGLQPLGLQKNQPQIWDGRFEICTSEDGWRVVPAHGWMTKLQSSERKALSVLPPALRSVLPVILSEGSETPYLAFGKVKLTSLSAKRFRLNAPAGMGETTQEAGLFAAIHSEKGSTALFSV